MKGSDVLKGQGTAQWIESLPFMAISCHLLPFTAFYGHPFGTYQGQLLPFDYITAFHGRLLHFIAFHHCLVLQLKGSER